MKKKGSGRAHHRFMLEQLMNQVEMLEGQIAAFESRMASMMTADEEKIERLKGIPGVDDRAARLILAEIGTDMSQFPGADHLCLWAGVCPGNHESAGKRRGDQTRRGSRWLRRDLVQAAWAASMTKNSCFRAQHRLIAYRRGMRRATTAIARSILTVIYHLLATGSVFKDVGAAFFDRINPRQALKTIVKRLDTLGFDVHLAPKVA